MCNVTIPELAQRLDVAPVPLANHGIVLAQKGGLLNPCSMPH
jgi:hypothetical protein